MKVTSLQVIAYKEKELLLAGRERGDLTIWNLTNDFRLLFYSQIQEL